MRPHIVSEEIYIPRTREKAHKKRYRVKGHWMRTRNGGRVYIKPHWVSRKKKSWTVRPRKYKRKELRFSGNFDEVARKIAREYEKKGMSKKEAEEIGRKTAGKIYYSKLAKAWGKK